MQGLFKAKSARGSCAAAGVALAVLLGGGAVGPAAALEDTDESVVIANESEPSDDAAAGAGEAVGEPAGDAEVEGEPSAGEAANPPPDDAGADAGDDPASPEALDGDKAKD